VRNQASHEGSPVTAPSDPIRDALQETVHSDWVLAHYVCVAAFQRLDDNGDMESSTVLFTQQGQGSYITDGLMMAASRLNECADEDVDEESE
jgi:hypothetical protein